MISMTSDPYFPDHRHLLPLTTIRRARMLPDAAGGSVEVVRGQRVSLLDTIARGEAPAPFMLIDAARALRVKPEALENLLLVRDGDEVAPGDMLAERGRRKVTAPVAGRIAAISRGQIVLRQGNAAMDLQAGLNGTVIDVRIGRGAVVEGYGGVLQGVWGNGRRGVGAVRLEPSDGIESLEGGGELDANLRGAIVVSRRPLRSLTLQLASDQGLGGLVVPSLPASMRAETLASRVAVLVVEGFGTMRMGVSAMQFLESNNGRQGSLDAVTPAPLESRVPELLVNVPFDPNDRPGAPNINIALFTGQQVRLLRGDVPGSIGTITNLPKMPIIMDNGLRMACAVVTLTTGEQVTTPLANLEVTGA